jgi:phage baseplate assembly protein W
MDIYFDYDSLTSVVTNKNAINNSIRNILLTRIGTLPGKPDFGSKIHNVLFNFMDSSTRMLLSTLIIEALLKWEPRITIQDVDVVFMEEYNRIIATITYSYKMIGINVTETAEIELKD